MWAVMAGLALCPCLDRAADEPWHVFYDVDAGFSLQPSDAWVGTGTRSEHTPEGLHIVDESTQGGSGRLYEYRWQVKPGEAVVAEVRLKAIQASEPWGACVNVADGVAEEDVSFFPDRVRLSYAAIEAPFPAGAQFHTYRIEVKAPDIRVWADDRLLLDGAGEFVHPVTARVRAGRRRHTHFAGRERAWRPPVASPDCSAKPEGEAA